MVESASKPVGRVPERIRQWLSVNSDVPWVVCVCKCGRWFADMDKLAPYHMDNCCCRHCDNKEKYPMSAKIHLRKCQLCQTEFLASRKRQKYCSLRCAAKYGRIKNPQHGDKNSNYKGAAALTCYEHKKNWKLRYPEKVKAHRIISRAVRRKEIIRRPCEVCGNPKSEGHHDDYSRPLEVRWLCRKHHDEITWDRNRDGWRKSK